MDIFKLFGIYKAIVNVGGRDHTTKELRRRADMASASKNKAKWERAWNEAHQIDRADKREELEERASTFTPSQRYPQPTRQLELPIDEDINRQDTIARVERQQKAGRNRNLPMASRSNLPKSKGSPRRSNLPAASPGKKDYPMATRKKDYPMATRKKDYPMAKPTETLPEAKEKKAGYLQAVDEKNLPMSSRSSLPADVSTKKPGKDFDWAKWKRDSDEELLTAHEKAAVPMSQTEVSDLGPGPGEVSNVDVPLDEGGMPQPYDIESDVRGEWGDYPTRPPYTTDYDITTGAHYLGKPDPRGEKADIRATRKHGVGIAPPSVIDKALFKMFGIKKEHQVVPHDDIPEFIPHPEIPGATMRNPEYTKYKHGGVTPPGEVPLGEGATMQERGPRKILADTFSPEKEGKPYRGR